MRVIYDHSVFMEARIGGVLRHVLELVRGIHELPEAGDVTIDVEAGLYHAPVTAADLPAGTLHGRRVPRFRGSGRMFSAINEFTLERTLRQVAGPGSILHETFYGNRARVPAGTKRVVVVHDTIWEDGLATQAWMAKGAQTKRRTINAADGIIFVSAATRTGFERLYGPARMSAVIHHGCELRTTRDRRSPGIDGPFVLYVGQRGGYKNWSGFISAFATSPVARRHAIVCFGSPPTPAEQCAVSALPHAANVIWRGGSDDELADLYAAASCFVYPSLAEGFGIPLVEAARLGCPVACSDIPPFREVMGPDAHYFDPTNATSMMSAVEAAINDGRLSRTVQAAEAACVGYTWQRTARETLAFYRRLATA